MKKILLVLTLALSVNFAIAQTIPCVGGMAGSYPCDNIDLKSFIPLSTFNATAANDIWGWTDATSGREFALMGLNNGTAFVEITDPEYPIYLGKLPTHTNNSTWRDIKVFNNYAFIVSEASGHGMQIFALNQLLSASSPPVAFSETAHYAGFGNCHNIVINENTGYAYAVGTNTCSGGLHMININNPLAPTSAGCFSSDGYTHDAQCVTYNGPDTAYQGHEICFCFNEDTQTIVDVTDKNNPIQVSKTGYAGSAYTHQGWLTDDHRYVLCDDELDEYYNGVNTRTFLWDNADLDNPLLLGYYSGTTTAIDHNQYIIGDYSYQSNYRAGLRILDISSIPSPNFNEVAYFDVYPSSNSPNFNGAWSVFPYFPSENIVISGIEQGLFVVRTNFGTPETDDAGISAINMPSGDVCDNFAINVSLKNYGTSALTSATISYDFGGSTTTYNWSGNLAAGSSTNVTIAINVSLSPGNYTLTVTTSLPNGNTDANTANDTSSLTFNVFANDADGDGVSVCDGDCDDNDPNNWTSCANCRDLDGDGWYIGCDAYVTINGPDCDDSNSAFNNGADNDADGFSSCELDCDDDNSGITPNVYSQNFNNGFPPTSWTINNPDNATTWANYNTNSCSKGVSAYFSNYYYNATGQQDALISQAYDLSSAVSAILTFEVAYAYYNLTQYYDQLDVAVSTDGINYTTLYSKSGSTLSTYGAATSSWVPSSCNHWRKETLNLDAYVGNATVYVKFTNITGYGNNLYLDDMRLIYLENACGACPDADSDGICDEDDNLWSCLSNLSITTSFTATGNIHFESSDIIVANSLIPAGANIQYDAADYIDLLAGFVAETGCDFTAVIDGCGNAKPLDSNDAADEAIIQQFEIADFSAAESLSTLQTFNFTIYPNPAKYSTTLSIQASHDTKALVKIIDTNGKSVANVYYDSIHKNVPYHLQIEVQHLPRGVYFVQIISQEGAQYVEKMVVE
ncbi:MAG: choice-of-anchor B family protein [Chitinophagales bacterium]|nr:choice-of-anchor B family protein [Bacteroidota bacterium]MCB9042325.1 choice-of-anchor B family protein [Chitinophagales bacterium]